MDINHNKVVYINKGEHDDPHELPAIQYSEGSTDIGHALYSHTTNSPPNIDSFKKLEYIYQHFRDSEKTYELDPDTDRQVPYIHILIMILNMVYLKMLSIVITWTVKDDFNCDKECYANTLQTQHN